MEDVKLRKPAKRPVFIFDRVSDETDTTMPHQLKDTWRQVGFTDESLRKWLLDFAQIDLARADSEKRVVAREELTCFIELWKTPAEAREVTFGRCPPPSAQFGTAIPEQDALAANRWLRRLLTKLAQNQRISFRPKLACTISRVQNARGWAIIHSIEGRSPLDTFQYQTYTAFAASARGHQACARCGRIFVPHGRSLYCSKTCSTVTRTLRWRANKKSWRLSHPEETRETAHRQYERRVHKTHGVNRKVTRRPRCKASTH
jgi:hypothetical protein